MGRETAKEEGVRHLLLSFARFDSWAGAEEIVAVSERRLDGFRVVRDLEPVPEAVLAEGRRIDAAKER